MNKTAEFLKRVDDVTKFCLSHPGRCFVGWSKEKIFLYVGFHALAGTLFVHRRTDKSVQSVAFAWPTTVQRVADVFNWKLPQPGDVLFIAEVVGDRAACRRFLLLGLKKWPAVKRFFTYRQSSLVELDAVTLRRFAP